MNFKWIAPFALGLTAIVAQAAEGLQTDHDKISYTIGIDLGRNFKSLGVNADLDLLVKGLRDGMNGAPAAMPESEMRERMAVFRTALLARENEVRVQAKADNKKKGAAFAQEFAQRSGARELSAGVLYRVLKEGSGKKPQAGDIVACNYRGTLVDGTQFDASEAGHAASFNLGGAVIPGWRMTLPQMTVGSRWEVMIPPELAYGDRGAGRDIPPGATLVFDIELVAAQAPTPSAH